MPQLDRSIIFTQFFWLFLTFVILYTLLTYYFLPLFLKSLKIRVLIIEQNIVEDEKIKLYFSTKQSTLDKTLHENLVFIKFKVFNNPLVLDKVAPLDLQGVDAYLFNVIICTTLYCSRNILNCVSFKPLIYNFFN